MVLSLKKSRRNRKGGLTKPLTKRRGEYTLVHVKSASADGVSLGVYKSLVEAKQELEKYLDSSGIFYVFSTENRVVYSKEGRNVHAE